MIVSSETKQKIDIWLQKYPNNQKQSAVMEALRLAQLQNNNVLNSDIIKEIADYLQMPIIKIMEVASFYENYNFNIVEHKYQIRICHNISCMLNGGDDLIEYLEKKLQVQNGEITKHVKFKLKKDEC